MKPAHGRDARTRGPLLHDDQDQVVARASATTQHEIYRRHCETQNIALLDRWE